MTLQDTPVGPDASTVWMQVRSIEPDKATGTVGAVLTDHADEQVLFVPLDGDGAPRTRPIAHGFSLLLDVIAGVGASIQHVDLALDHDVEAHPDARGHTRVRAAELVLSDASVVRCAPAKALAISIHTGVSVRLTGDVRPRLVVPAVPAQARPDAVHLPA